MQNLQINNGCKTYSINGDENAVITVKTTDFALLGRLDKLMERIGSYVRELETIEDGSAEEVYLSALSKADEKVRAELDRAFDSPVSAAVFGGMNCLSFAGGQPVAVNFLEAILPVIRADLEEEQKASEAKLGKYTEAVRRFS